MADEPELAMGSDGEWVTYLERLLAEAGYWHGDSASVFDETLERAVVEYQTYAGLPSDGVVRPDTWARLTATASPGSEAGTDPANFGGPFTDQGGGARGFSTASVQIVITSHRGEVDGLLFGNEPVQFSALVTNPHADAETGQVDVTWTLDGTDHTEAFPSLAPGASDWVVWDHDAITALGEHTISVSWRPAGPYTEFGAGHRAFTVLAPAQSAGGAQHRAGFGHVSFIATEWGELVFPSPAQYAFAATLDSDTQVTVRAFESLNAAWQADAPTTGVLDQCEAYLAVHGGTFEADIGRRSQADHRTANEMETQRELVDAVNEQLGQLLDNLTKAQEDLGAAESELESVRQYEEARELAEQAERSRVKLAALVETFVLPAKAAVAAVEFEENPYGAVETVTEAFVQAGKLAVELHGSSRAQEAQHEAARTAMTAAAQRIESAENYIKTSRQRAEAEGKQAGVALRHYIQLRAEAEHDFDRANPGGFRFADLAAQLTKVRSVEHLINELMRASEHAGGLAHSPATYQQTERNLTADRDDYDQDYVDALRKSGTTLTPMAVTANTMHAEATEQQQRQKQLHDRLQDMRNRADKAMSSHPPAGEPDSP